MIQHLVHVFNGHIKEAKFTVVMNAIAIGVELGHAGVLFKGVMGGLQRAFCWGYDFAFNLHVVLAGNFAGMNAFIGKRCNG